MLLECGFGKIINIYEAIWGRFDTTTCKNYPNFSRNCSTLDDTLYRIRERCHGKNRCVMYLDDNTLLNPCQEYEKYLQVRWGCAEVNSRLIMTCFICKNHVHRIRCSKTSVIYITAVFWGRREWAFCGFEHPGVNCSSDVALDIISGQCDYKRQCFIKPDVKALGDPCPGMGKFLRLDYMCIRVDTKKVCENHRVVIDCGDQIIFITQAQYGRSHPFACNKPQGLEPEPIQNPQCASRNIISTIAAKCNNKNVCDFFVTRAEFGTHCGFSGNYLFVNYICRNPGDNDVPDFVLSDEMWVQLSPGPPIVISLGENSAKIHVNWTKPMHYHIYAVQIKLVYEETWRELFVGKTLDFNKILDIEGLKPCTTYYIRVILKNCNICDNYCIPYTKFTTQHPCCLNGLLPTSKIK
ncbi:unnamed protein product [Nezara viridula]|nr:unnamed protein product [Nezara viridula]